MNINRNNYEEYFLLYADNELSAQEKNAVEDFVRQHPDLEEELLLFKLSVTKPDVNCKLEDKSFLFKEPGKFINHSNYEEVFVLYNDDELTTGEREETENFLSANPSVKNEFELLQRVKLQADNTIVFPGKNILYRNEEKAKIIRFKWWRLAAAATLFGAGLWFGVEYFQKKDKLPEIVKNDTQTTPAKSKPVNSDTITETPNIVAESKYTEKKKQELVKRNAGKPSLKQTYLPISPVEKKEIKKIPGSEIMAKKIEVKPIKESEPSLVQAQNNIAEVKKESDAKYASEKPGNDIADANKDTTPVFTAFTEANENSYNYAFYNIPQEKFNKTKFGGFLRKVKRIVERRISPFGKDKTETEVN